MRREVGWSDADLDLAWRERFVELYEREFRAGELRYFVAEVEGEIVGSAVAFVKRSLSDAYERRPRRGYLANVYVDKAHRRRGVARALTQASIDWLRTLGCGAVLLQASNEGQPLYESMGFTRTNEMELRW